jgi:hypothetical protein
VTGFDELARTLRRFASGGEMVAAVRPEMNRVAAKILRRSVALTPRDRGALVNSANLKTEASGGALSVTLGYGTPYAYAVHQRPRSGKTGGVSPSGRRYRHWAAVGEYRYLAKAMEEAEHTAWPDVARGLEAWLRSHGR